MRKTTRQEYLTRGAHALAFALASVMTGALGGCGSYPPPADKMATTTAAARSAEELGASKTPQAEFHLKLAQEQLADAKKLMVDGENKRAEFVLMRANSDAELALILARQAAMKADAQKAQDDVRALKRTE